MTGLFWTGGSRLLGQMWTWVVTIIVIRLLNPADFGLLAMATVFVSFFVLVAEAGLGAALIQARELDDLTLRRVFGALIIIDCSLFLLQFTLAPAIARFFDEERLVMIIRVLALQFLLMIFTAIPSALLSRNLDFKRQSIIALIASVFGSLTSLVLAFKGYGVWALVISNIVVCVWHALAINVVAPYLRRPDFSFRGLRGLIGAGSQLTAARVLWFLYSQADIFIAGKVLGTELLGFYSVAMHLASLPVQRLSAVLNQIAYPAFAEASRNEQAIAFYMLKAVRILSLAAFPVLWGISAIAPEIVAVVLGPSWERAIIPLQILPLIMPISMVGLFLNTAFQGIGRADVAFSNSLTAAVVMPAAFLAGVQWELLGLSVAWVVGYTIVFLLNLRRMLPMVGLRMLDILRAGAMPALAASAMYGGVSVLRHQLAEAVSLPLLMPLLIITGAGIYAAVTLVTNRDRASELIDLFRKRAEGGAP